jgi:hypothetical protein
MYTAMILGSYTSLGFKLSCSVELSSVRWSKAAMIDFLASSPALSTYMPKAGWLVKAWMNTMSI